MNFDRSPSPASGKNLRDRLSLWDKFAIISEKQQDGVVELTNLASLPRQVHIHVPVLAFCIHAICTMESTVSVCMHAYV